MEDNDSISASSSRESALCHTMRFLRSWTQYDYEAALNPSGEPNIPPGEHGQTTETWSDPEDGSSEDQIHVVDLKPHRYSSSCRPCLLHFRARRSILGVLLALFVMVFWWMKPALFGHTRVLQSPNPPILQFRQGQNGSFFFKIVQITDIHLGEAPDLDWGPLQDRKTWQVLDAVLTSEAPVDLIVLGGDQLTANNCKDNATAYYQELGDFLSGYGIPWALVFGNHDDTDFETKDEQKIPAKYLRKDLLLVDQSFPLSLTQAGPPNVNGTTNYVLDIYSGVGMMKNMSEVAAQVFLLDTGGGSIEKAITDSQVAWVQEQASKSFVPAVAFQHIPTLSHAFVEESCKGLHNDSVASVPYDGGIMEALSKTNRFFFLAAGHNHGNDYCCPYQAAGTEAVSRALHACFGRRSGYGGYGRWERGSRVYQLEWNKLSEESGRSSNEANGTTESTVPSPRRTMQWSSWVRLESGEVVDGITRS